MYKSFFGLNVDRIDKSLCDLGLPTFKTVIHNAQVKLDSSVDVHSNELVQHVFHIWKFYCVERVICCLSVCLFCVILY